MDMTVPHDAKMVEAFAKLKAKYSDIATMTQSVAEGKTRSLVVSGQAGVGKSHGVKTTLLKYKANDHQIVAGHITDLILFKALWEHRKAQQVVLLDDCDSIVSNAKGLNLLKAAMDLKGQRRVSFESSTHMLASNNIPPTFEFNGSVILITNESYTGTSKASKHLKAVVDRSFLITVGEEGLESKWAMILYKVQCGGLLDKYEISEHVKAMLVDWLYSNIEHVNTLSLRTMEKLADLYVMFPNQWQSLAITTLTRE